VNKENKPHKILVVGDSHARGCTARIKDHLSDSLKMCGYVTPGLSTNILITTASTEINNLTKMDAIVLVDRMISVGIILRLV
jgi:hypothetical protein